MIVTFNETHPINTDVINLAVNKDHISPKYLPQLAKSFYFIPTKHSNQKVKIKNI